jgi:hypothetical protein
MEAVLKDYPHEEPESTKQYTRINYPHYEADDRNGGGF